MHSRAVSDPIPGGAHVRRNGQHRAGRPRGQHSGERARTEPQAYAKIIEGRDRAEGW